MIFKMAAVWIRHLSPIQTGLFSGVLGPGKGGGDPPPLLNSEESKKKLSWQIVRQKKKKRSLVATGLLQNSAYQ